MLDCILSRFSQTEENRLGCGCNLCLVDTRSNARHLHITVKELLQVVVVLALAIWGHKWQGSVIRCRCDNAAVYLVLVNTSM